MTRIAKTFSNYKQNTGGNVAMMFAISTFALIGGIALAVDLSNAYSAKQRLQDTTDAVALMAAKDKSLDTPEELTATAQALYDVTYPGERGARIVIQSMTRNGDSVEVVTKNNVDSFFSGVFGRKSLDVGVSSTAVYSDTAMDIAMVLDTTYSMSENNKIGSLKTAATQLVSTIDALDNDKVRVSVVPFAQYVNVGTQNRNAPWLDVPVDGRDTTPRNQCRITRPVIARSNCRRIARTCSADGVSYDCSYTKCDNTYGAPVETCNTVTPVAKTWQGCVGSREAGYDERAEFAGRKIPGLFGKRCGAPLTALSTNMNKAKQTINQMQAARGNGATYIPSGILWGWRTLDETMPFPSGAVSANVEREKIMIVMTDGANEAVKQGVEHRDANGNSAVRTNRKTQDLCTAAKRDDVTIYTIAYEVSDSSTINMLDRCASDSSKFFDARNASDLSDAFRKIGDSLVELRTTS
jgi:Flp pilus assembly protein TadG